MLELAIWFYFLTNNDGIIKNGNFHIKITKFVQNFENTGLKV